MLKHVEKHFFMLAIWLENTDITRSASSFSLMYGIKTLTDIESLLND